MSSRILIIVVSLLILSGCVDIIAKAADYRTSYAQNLQRIPSYNEQGECKAGYCVCMVCKNGTGFFGTFNSLAGGECFFVNPCNHTEFNSWNDGTYGKDFASRTFMLGAGPDFVNFGDANPYCHNRLTMAVHWLVGDEKRDYDLPDTKRALCMLDKNVIPLYVLYSNSENVDAGRAFEIGRVLGSKVNELRLLRIRDFVGPTIVTTEIDYNGTDPYIVRKVADQVRQLYTGCGNKPDEIHCFVALAPKMGDTAALDAVMRELGNDRYMVSLVAFGINSHYADGCDPATIRTKAAHFAKYALYNHSLPTVIPYVLFDPGTTDSTGKCTWNEDSVNLAYAGFFPNSILMLRDSGVIGIAPYDFNASSRAEDPLRCNSCGLGENNLRLSSWFGGCQRFAKIAEKQPGVGFPIVFPNESGGECNFAAQTEIFSRIYEDSYSRDLMDEIIHPLDEIDKELFRCDACLAEGKDITEIYPVFKEAGDKWPYLKPTGETLNALCTIFPEIDYYASKFNVDPMLMRAIARTESGMNPCRVTCTPRGGGAGTVIDSSGIERQCIDGNYNIGMNYMEDPQRITYEGPEVEALFGSPSIYCPDLIHLPPNYDTVERPSYRIMGLGLMQTMEPPYTFWPAAEREDGVDGEYYWEYFADIVFDEATNPDGRRTNYAGARYCSPYFNPFNVSHSACWGTAKMSGLLHKGAVDWIRDAEATCAAAPYNYPDVFGVENDLAKKEILTAFIAVYMSTGAWGGTTMDPENCYTNPTDECWLSHYCEAKTLIRDTNNCEPYSDGSCPTGCVHTAAGGNCLVLSGGGISCCKPSEEWCFDQADNFIQFVWCIINRNTARGPRIFPGALQEALPL